MSNSLKELVESKLPGWTLEEAAAMPPSGVVADSIAAEMGAIAQKLQVEGVGPTEHVVPEDHKLVRVRSLSDGPSSGKNLTVLVEGDQVVAIQG